MLREAEVHLSQGKSAKQVCRGLGMKDEASEIIQKRFEIMKNRLASGEEAMISGLGKGI